MTPAAGTTPSFKGKSFTCPNCFVVATHTWEQARFPTHQNPNPDPALWRSTCTHCEQRAYWVNKKLIAPEPTFGDDPSPDLPEQFLPLYQEARSVAPRSERAAAALLRLLVDQLVQHLGGEGSTLDKRIENLQTKRALAQSVINAMDAVRLTGNRAVHESQIDPAGEDDAGVVELLFRIVNSIADALIGLPRQTTSLVGHKARPHR